MENPGAFNPKSHFPPRRRALQACATCRQRKTRCDSQVPKCQLCIELNVECVYLDSQSPKIDTNTRVLLDRIQQLEDKLLALPSLSGKSQFTAETKLTSSPIESISQRYHSPPGQFASSIAQSETASLLNSYPGSLPETTSEPDGRPLTLLIAHTATADSVYRWPILQAILSKASTTTKFSRTTSFPPSLSEATDVFYLESFRSPWKATPDTWRLFHSEDLTASSPNRVLATEQINSCTMFLEEYFLNVHIFFPLLRQDQIISTLSKIVKSECDRQLSQDSVGKSQYCLLLLVLGLGSWVKSGGYRISTSDLQRFTRKNYPQHGDDHSIDNTEWTGNTYWQKATLLLGSMISDNELEAAQCYALAGIFMGSQGRSIDSHTYMHTAAAKCVKIARRCTLKNNDPRVFSDSFRRLFWIVYIYESDFLSELSITTPSGIVRFEEIVPYPTAGQVQMDDDTEMEPVDADSCLSPGFQAFLSSMPWKTKLHQNIYPSDVAAFQISTNSAIRRFLNRVHSVIYDQSEAWRKNNHQTYITRLLKLSQELNYHNDAIHSNLPSFLLNSDPVTLTRGENESNTSRANSQSFSSHPWNVARLKGRYAAGKYVIHRSFVEYVLLNPTQFEIHPLKMEILENCKKCIEGCYAFVSIFSIELTNPTTGLFATGMTTFAMVIVLMISTLCTAFHSILPPDVEEAIVMGQLNLRRFSMMVKEFEWHLQELEKLDDARKMGMS